MEEVTNMFWTNLAKQYDFDKNGEIDPFELTCMLQAVGSTLDDTEIEDLTRDKGDVRIPMLPEIMRNARKNHLVRITHCPVCQDRITTSRENSSNLTCKELSVVATGRSWEGSACIEDAEVIAHIGPCVNQQIDEDLLTRNFVVDMVGISWWKDGLPEFNNYTQHIRDSGNFVVYDRIAKKTVEEKIPVFAKLAMRAVYSVLPRKPEVAKDFLRKMTQIVGNKYSDPKSRRHIPEFIRFYEINVDDLQDPVSSFQNFNEFFRRKMKPHSRPVADIRNQHIAVVPADCRIVGYESVAEATTVWVKGHAFTIETLVGDKDLTRRFTNGSVALCRLGPMDSHRFFFPIGGKVGKTFNMDGDYLVDNPIAVREDVDIFTTNKRTVTVIEDTEFGLVAMVCVGSTMVGSIELTSKQGRMVKKGDEHGYFQFGGSTIILLFEANSIVFAEDILINSAIPIETYCRTGSPLGVLRK
jgi:phosphatidylserine decarboxylase